MKNIVIEHMLTRGITIDEIGDIVFDLQRKYNPNLTMETCIEASVTVKGSATCRFNRIGFRQSCRTELLPEPLGKSSKKTSPMELTRFWLYNQHIWAIGIAVSVI